MKKPDNVRVLSVRLLVSQVLGAISPLVPRITTNPPTLLTILAQERDPETLLRNVSPSSV